MIIRRSEAKDAESIWRIFSSIVADGTTFVHLPDEVSEENICRYWLEEVTSFVAEDQDEVIGAYYLRPNQVGRGSHIANATYMVDATARGRGVGEALGRHSLGAAVELGYLAIQFNAVVSTNESAVKLWKKIGFDVIGTVPKGFRHPGLGYVDLYIMFQWLGEGEA